MRRRHFITLVGGAAAATTFAPCGLRAQQPRPVIGFLHSKALGVTVPLPVLARADEVIE